jgi:hypothetical protein
MVGRRATVLAIVALALTSCGTDENACHLSAGQPSWIAGLDGHGATARVAVSHTLGAFERETGLVYHARQIGRGDEESRVQTWLARRQGGTDGFAGFTIAVTRTSSEYVAGPDSVCD